MADTRKISQNWQDEVLETDNGVVPTGDNSSIGTDLTAWNKFSNMLERGIQAGSFSSQGIITTQSMTGITGASFSGAVLAANGDVHLVPSSASMGVKISRSGIISTYSLIKTGTEQYSGGVLDTNGDIHFVPYAAQGIVQKVSASGVVSTYALAITGPNVACSGGVLAPNGDIHFISSNVPVDSVGHKISASGVVSTYSLIIKNLQTTMESLILAQDER